LPPRATSPKKKAPGVTAGASSPFKPGGITEAASFTPSPKNGAPKGSFEDVVTEESIASYEERRSTIPREG